MAASAPFLKTQVLTLLDRFSTSNSWSPSTPVEKRFRDSVLANLDARTVLAEYGLCVKADPGTGIVTLSDAGLGSTTTQARERARLQIEAELERPGMWDYGGICSGLVAAVVDAALALWPDGPFTSPDLRRIRALPVIPFCESWSIQIDISFEGGAEGGDIVAYPDANVFTPQMCAAWEKLAARPGRVHRDYMYRCYKAIPHEVVHCMQTRAGQTDPTRWSAEHDASFLSGGLLLEAARRRGVCDLFPRGLIEDLRLNWQEELQRERSTIGSQGVDAEYDAWRASFGMTPPGAVVSATPGASYYIENRLACDNCAESSEQLLKQMRAFVWLAVAVIATDIPTLTFLGMESDCTARHTVFRYRVSMSAGQDLAAIVFGLPIGTPLILEPYTKAVTDTVKGVSGLRWDLPSPAAAGGRGATVSIVVNDIYTKGSIQWVGVLADGSVTRVSTIEGPVALVAPPVLASEPDSISWTMTIRDFGTHDDFEHYMGDDRHIVKPTLGSDGTPEYAGGIHPTVTSGRSFYDWYHDTSSNKRFELPMAAHKVANITPALYEYNNPAFFPIDNMGFMNNFNGHNYGFTMTISTLFTYHGGETFFFRGDDDVWVFINKQLVIDLGGVHSAQEKEVHLDTLGLKVNETYPLNLFFAERHTVESSFRMTTTLKMEQYCTGAKCECPGLNNVEAQHLKDPATHTVALSGSFSDDVDLYIALPQMLPHRWNVRAAFINPKTFATTQVGLPMQEDPCRYTHRSTRRLPDLIRTAQPRIIEDTDRYRLQFLVRVWCNERFTLANGESYDRNSTFDLSFEVVLFRRVEVRSTVDTLDATLVWGYIEKFSVMVPLDRSQPTVEFDLVTVAVEQDYAIDAPTFVFRSSVGHIVTVTNPSFESIVDGRPNVQRWHLRATISQYSICSTNANDRFTLDYTIRSSRPHSAEHASSLTASLEGLENWCMLNTTLRLNGAQSTFADTAATSETIRFFLGDWVHVRDHVNTDLQLLKTNLLKSVLSGSALVTGTALTLFDASTPSTPSTPSTLGFALEDCPRGYDFKWVCYRFSLASTHFNIDKDLTIVSTLRVDIDKNPAVVARADGTEETATVARVSSSLALASAHTEAAAGSVLTPVVSVWIAVAAIALSFL
eukprot:m51a1_g10797 putative C-tail anchored protein (1129) ;mRNA; r:2029-7231